MKKAATAEAIDRNDLTTRTPLTSFILGGLERLEWEIERIDITLRGEDIHREDRNAIAKAFVKISRECDVLRKWLRDAPIEESRN
jgi:hypothetical protein